MSGFPNFCDTCRNILDEIEGGAVRYCRYCDKNKPIGNDRLLNMVYYDNVVQKLSADAVMRLAAEKTTLRLEKTCTECGFGIMAIVMDSDLHTTHVCLKCTTIFT